MGANYENPKSVPCSEILNSGSRLSAREDFLSRTISVLRGVWSKLNYIRELRRPDGTYEHWGLDKTHGELETNKAIAHVHSDLYLQLLRTPLQELLAQLELSAKDSDCSPRQLAWQLYQYQRKITPKELRGGPPEHLRSVLITTDLLTRCSEKRTSSS